MPQMPTQRSTPAPSDQLRTIHLIDLENLLGGTYVSEAEVTAGRVAYMHQVGIGPQDVVVIATSHVVAQRAWFGWRDARRLVRSGPDGADLALLDVIANENLAARYGRVIVASGDGIFAEPCARLQEAGCHVMVVSQVKSLSRRLSFAVRDLCLFEFTPAMVRVASALRRAA